jgi:hypothetical protein
MQSMALQVTKDKNHEFLEHHGDEWRMERYYQQNPDGSWTWGVYQRTHTGLEHPEVDKKTGEVTKPGLLGIHPVHKGETHDEYVWVKKHAGSEESAREYISKHGTPSPRR